MIFISIIETEYITLGYITKKTFLTKIYINKIILPKVNLIDYYYKRRINEFELFLLLSKIIKVLILYDNNKISIILTENMKSLYYTIILLFNIMIINQ